MIAKTVPKRRIDWHITDKAPIEHQSPRSTLVALFQGIAKFSLEAFFVSSHRREEASIARHMLVPIGEILVHEHKIRRRSSYHDDEHHKANQRRHRQQHQGFLAHPCSASFQIAGSAASRCWAASFRSNIFSTLYTYFIASFRILGRENRPTSCFQNAGSSLSTWTDILSNSASELCFRPLIIHKPISEQVNDQFP